MIPRQSATCSRSNFALAVADGCRMNLAIVLALLATAQIPAEVPATTSWAAKGAAIRLVQQDGENLVNYVFEVQAEGRQRRQKTMMAKQLTLEKAWLGPDGQLIVLGRAGSRASHLMLEVPGEAQNLWFRAWRNEVSPSGKFLALERLHPAHGGDGPDLVTIYDLTRSLEANLQEGQIREQTFGPLDCVGRVVFPEEPTFRRICEPGPNDVVRMLASPFLWRQKGDVEQLFFLVLEANTVFLIRTSLPTPTEPVVIWRQEIDLRGRYQPEPHNDYNFKPALKVYFDKLSWAASGRILVELDPIYGFGSSFEIEAD